MTKGALLFWTAAFLGFTATDIASGSEHYGFIVFEGVIGVGLGANLIKRFIKESE